ncbi:transcription termination factor 2 isoform X2 [Cheilinus undulatus]|uniref:transcription termination factor 2 isoform X2 n=1 Tax=Cheilinus undulatus TaxID=241271 RepID=UPI001BD210F3|nr:transcription termination factor 2 isoform X2 [Cheilinus undulatus]
MRTESVDTMEKVLCNEHGCICMLKTGVKDGPNKGKSFYVCVDKQGCDFSLPASISPSHCLHHEDSIVELQALTYNLQQQSHRLFFRCVVGKKAGQRWCGNVPWRAPEKENRNPQSSAKLQPSCLPPVRNPFKAPGRTDKDSELKRMQGGGGEEKRKEEKERQDKGEGIYHKEKEEIFSAAQKEDDERKQDSSDTYRGKQLPAGMKLKKRVSDEERHSSDADSVEKMTDKAQDKSKESHTEQANEPNPVFVAKVVHPEKTNQPTKDPHKDLQKEPTDEETSLIKQADPSVKDSSTKSISIPNTSTQTYRDPEKMRKASSDKPMQAESSQKQQEKDGDDDDVVVVSVKPATQKTPPVSAVQKTLTAYPGFNPASVVKSQQQGLHSLLTAQLQQKKATLSVVNVAALPDKGERLRTQVKELEDALESLSITVASQPGSQGASNSSDASAGSSHVNPFSRKGGTILLPAPPAAGPYQNQAPSSSLGLQLSQGYTPMYGANPQVQAFYGGRMTEDRLLAVKNATCEAIDHLHKSLESCPDAENQAPDPRGLKVSLLAHQKRALAWLLWRETQNPCGGILADDMGLGKTLTMISVILSTKKKAKEEEEKKEEEKQEGWISKTDSSVVVSKGTLIICPASLVHHWKREIDRHVKTGRLSVYLYHGPNREKSAKVLADHDVVVTTYSLVSKEIPVQKDDAEQPSKDAEKVPSHSAPLLRVTWARVILDEAHNIKNPKVQTSMAVCQLRAQARWAVTGTPIQNNLLDMYSLLKFLRCAPFDEYKLWKAQVDNGSKRGRERLNILTRTLLLRRTKDQLDTTGKPLVSLPDRTCEVHQLKLSKDEQAVYDVVFAQSRSTLQNYLKRHEGNDLKKGNTSTSNPFDKVAQEFGMSQVDTALSSSQQPQQASSTVHILSLLLRLRQCCCHLSLLKKTLDSAELQGDGIILSLEEQLNALSLSSSPSPSCPDPKGTVALNGTRFPSQLFEETSESSKISAIISELRAIKQKGADQRSVIVSQWTSMLHIVAVHLKQMGLKYGVIDGTVNPKRRMDLVEDFNTNPKGPQVMLVSLCAGGVGLNLIGGNHLFLIDMHWNPALEDQACDRIYRVGQTKDVTIHRFVCEGTVEEKISTLQGKKKELAQNVLSGTGNTFTKLSLADLKIIFGV